MNKLLALLIAGTVSFSGCALESDESVELGNIDDMEVSGENEQAATTSTTKIFFSATKPNGDALMKPVAWKLYKSCKLDGSKVVCDSRVVEPVTAHSFSRNLVGGRYYKVEATYNGAKRTRSFNPGWAPITIAVQF